MIDTRVKIPRFWDGHKGLAEGQTTFTFLSVLNFAENINMHAMFQIVLYRTITDYTYHGGLVTGYEQDRMQGDFVELQTDSAGDTG